MKPAAAVRHFNSRFAAIGSRSRGEGTRAYLKSDLRFHGINALQLRTEAAAFCRNHPDLDRARLIAIVDALYASDWFELRWVAIALLEREWRLLTPRDATWLGEL